MLLCWVAVSFHVPVVLSHAQIHICDVAMQVDGVPNSICFNHPFRVRNPDLPTFFFDVPGPAQKLKDEKEADRQRRVLWLYGELINPRTKRAPIIINIYIYIH